jgi:hypothetical protein
MKTYRIKAKYGHHVAEEIDTAESEDEANSLVGEYRMAYGAGWAIWWTSSKKRLTHSTDSQGE